MKRLVTHLPAKLASGWVSMAYHKGLPVHMTVRRCPCDHRLVEVVMETEDENTELISNELTNYMNYEGPKW